MANILYVEDTENFRILATLKAELGSLNRVKRLIKTLGMVNSAPDFLDHPKVINGCSELFAQVFGEGHDIGRPGLQRVLRLRLGVVHGAALHEQALCDEAVLEQQRVEIDQVLSRGERVGCAGGKASWSKL